MTAIDPVLALLHPLWLASLVPAARRFEGASKAPAKAQRDLLLRRLAENSGSAYGRAHGFATIRSVADYQRRVPIVRYDELAPWIDRIVRAGEPGVLTTEPVKLMERSGGSTGSATKLVPYTASLLADFQRATGPWLWDLYRRFPKMIGRPAYWSLSPVAQGPKATAGGVPIGIADDSEYFGTIQRRVVTRSLAVPGAVARAPDFATWRRETLVHLMRCERLGFISVWSPTFMTALMEALVADPAPIRGALTPARARALDQALAERSGTSLWPDLQAISCWADGPAAAFVPALERWFPGVPIAPKGLLATEGVVSIPIGAGAGAALALTSTFLEFIDLESPERTPRLPDEVAVGGRYSPVITTGGGLYRYHLEDIVECVAPLRVRFVGKLDQVSDLTGEKLHAAQVQAALDDAGRALGLAWDFAFVAPIDATPPFYALFVDGTGADELAARVDALLREGHAYRYSRDLGQLGPLVARPIPGLRARYEAALVARGQRLGDIKPTALDRRPFWGDIFP